MEGAELEFREDALRAVARKAMQRKTGARGLRTILENVLLDTMYDLPCLRNVQKVVVDESVIEGNDQAVYRASHRRGQAGRSGRGSASPDGFRPPLSARWRPATAGHDLKRGGATASPQLVY